MGAAGLLWEKARWVEVALSQAVCVRCVDIGYGICEVEGENNIYLQIEYLDGRGTNRWSEVGNRKKGT